MAQGQAVTELCRDCLRLAPASPGARCPACGSPRLLRHAELDRLSLAHLDSDAFYAAVEKRDRPELRDRPVIVGGGRRGVVSAACYVARTYGVRSAMPMFKALQACPHASVIRPDMAKYAAVSRHVRTILLSATPLVEPLSLDEAFLDLTGTEALHHRQPAQTLAALAERIEREIGITVSVGLSYNKFLAKIASELDKPRGFAVIGRSEAPGFLASRPVGIIFGVGQAMQRKLAADGIRLIGEVQGRERGDLVARYGAMGERLWAFARGHDTRPVDPAGERRSISAETTFEADLADRASLEAVLWRLAEKVSLGLKRAELASEGVALKLKTAEFRLRTRHARLAAPSQLAEQLFAAAAALLAREVDGTRFRLIGLGCDRLCPPPPADAADLADPDAGKRAAAERAVDRLRERFGAGAIGKGRGVFPARPPR
ncbi:MAG: DNA polymerase IV [Alphaproteobacteria bacterium]|nr:DNA polymerase IV [Alphaproteobacteria bacterium]